MARQRPPEVTQEDRDTYAREGAVCLRGVYDRADTETVLEAWDRLVADPEATSACAPPPRSGARRAAHRQYSSVGPAFMVPEFKSFLADSPVTGAAGGPDGVRDYIGFYWDAIFAKDAWAFDVRPRPGTTIPGRPP